MGRNASVPSSSSRTFFSSRLGAQAKEAGVSDMAAAAEAGSAGGSTQTGNVYKDTAIGRGLGFIRWAFPPYTTFT